MSAYLTYRQRLEIEASLKENREFSEIAKHIEKDRTTVAKEIKKNSKVEKTGSSRHYYNSCIYRMNCKKKNICEEECTRKSAYFCRLCTHCNTRCNDFVEEVCTILRKPPYVCNGCLKKEKCTLKKRVYRADFAQAKADNSISNARRGSLANDQELMRIKNIITPLMEKGQSVHQIYLKYSDVLMCSEKTIYNYINSGLLGIMNMNLPRNAKRGQGQKDNGFKIDRKCRIGRTYEHYKRYMERNPELSLVQMNIVVGKSGGKVILTLHFVDTGLMLSFLLEAGTAENVAQVFKRLRRKLGDSLYKELFPVILSDNGSEFSNPREIEYDERGLLVSRIFYCDEGNTYQKRKIKENHELIQRILPKGYSFNNLTQEDISKVTDHINSYRRKRLNNKSPYEAFQFYYGGSVLDKLGCTYISPEHIIMKPWLLK